MTIARQVRAYLDGNPAIREYLALGVVNMSALARIIGQQLGINQRAAVEAACRRYRVSTGGDGRGKGYRRFLQGSRLETRGRVALVTIQPSEEAGPHLEPLLRELLTSERLLRIIPTSEELLLLVTDDAVAPVSRDSNRLGIVKIRRDLVEIRVRFSESLEKVPGAVASLSAAFGAEGIEILQSVGADKDILLLIDRKDLESAYRVIARMME